VYSLAFSTDGHTLAAGGCVPVDQTSKGCADSKGQITLWDVTQPANPPLADIRGHSSLVKAVAFSHNGNLLASGSYDTNIILWNIKDLTKPSQSGKPLDGHSSFVNDLAFSANDNVLVSAGDDQTIRLWNTSAPQNMGPIGSPKKQSASMTSIAFSPDGKKIAAASDNATILLWGWDEASRSLLPDPTILQGHTGFVKSVAFSVDGSLLASAGFDNKIILWNTSTGQQVGPPLNIHSGAINAVAFGVEHADGKDSPYLVSASNDRTMIRWDLSARQPISYTVKATGDLPTPELTASNGELNAGATGQQIDVRASDTAFLTLGGFDSAIRYVQFDGQNLLTMDQNQMSAALITHWNIDSAEWVNLACKAVGRNLTTTEWSDYLPNQQYRKTCESNP
jgi:WD40 repeat protein